MADKKQQKPEGADDAVQGEQIAEESAQFLRDLEESAEGTLLPSFSLARHEITSTAEFVQRVVEDFDALAEALKPRLTALGREAHRQWAAQICSGAAMSGRYNYCEHVAPKDTE